MIHIQQQTDDKNLSRRMHLHIASDLPILGLDATDFAVFVHLEGIYRGVEHVCASINSTQTAETLGQTPKAVDRINKWRSTVARDRIHVQLDSLHGLLHGLLQVAEEEEAERISYCVGL